MSDPLYISTAIPFVNAQPHLGFALELCIADALARHARARGQPVHFVSGTDEHSLKNVLAAERCGRPTRDFVSAQAARFQELHTALGTSIDAFVQTSAHAGHRAAVDALWRACAARGDLYLQTYSGLYCVGCERFADAGETACSEHAAPLEQVSEQNWFFRLSRHAARLRSAILDRELRIVPDAARAEILALLERPLPDLCVSRSAARARGWGLLVPDDPGQVIWVWFDALAYYLSALGFGSADDAAYRRLWDGRSQRLHVIGKGITRFHAIVWPAILASAGLPWPSELLVHGYLTQHGEKISKSGSALDPFPLLADFGADAVRYYLLRHVRTTRDGDFSLERLLLAYNAELANGLGNLVDRTLGLVARSNHGCVPPRGAADSATAELEAAAQALPARVDAALAGRALDEALAAVFELVALANRCLDRTAPWERIKRGELAAANGVLRSVLESLRAIASELSPFLPGCAARLLAQLPVTDAGELRDGAPLPAALRLFPRRDPQ